MYTNGIYHCEGRGQFHRPLAFANQAFQGRSASMLDRIADLIADRGPLSIATTLHRLNSLVAIPGPATVRVSARGPLRLRHPRR